MTPERWRRHEERRRERAKVTAAMREAAAVSADVEAMYETPETTTLTVDGVVSLRVGQQVVFTHKSGVWTVTKVERSIITLGKK